MNIRKANSSDIDSVTAVYEKVHSAEEHGLTSTGWKRETYPVRSTAQAAVERDDLFILEENGIIIGTVILNQLQVDVYRDGSWKYPAPDELVMVMHTLAIDPDWHGNGYGKMLERYYERYALENGCRYLRIDTNAINTKARAFYKSLGYEEAGIVPCVFNGLPNINLVLLEKKLT